MIFASPQSALFIAVDVRGLRTLSESRTISLALTVHPGWQGSPALFLLPKADLGRCGAKCSVVFPDDITANYGQFRVGFGVASRRQSSRRNAAELAPRYPSLPGFCSNFFFFARHWTRHWTRRFDHRQQR